MKLTKKKLIYIAIAIVAVAAITFGTVFVINLIKTNQQNSVVTTETAGTKKDQAIEALKNDDNTAAKTLFEEAKSQYEELGDTNNVVDTDAQLFLLEHANDAK